MLANKAQCCEHRHGSAHVWSESTACQDGISASWSAGESCGPNRVEIAPPALADGRVGWRRGPGRREANRGRSRGADGAVAEPEQALSETWPGAAGLQAGGGLKGENDESAAEGHEGKGREG